MREITLDDIKLWNATRQVRSMRTRNIRKITKPYTSREVVFTCSNGWTIEKLVKADFPVEGFFMGHCLGSNLDHYSAGGFYSLREPDGTPHVTIHYNICFGRANAVPRSEYMVLIQEWLPFATGYSIWGNDTDEAYHKRGLWDDKDWQDNPACPPMYRGKAWKEKRGQTTGAHPRSSR